MTTCLFLNACRLTALSAHHNFLSSTFDGINFVFHVWRFKSPLNFWTDSGKGCLSEVFLELSGEKLFLAEKKSDASEDDLLKGLGVWRLFGRPDIKSSFFESSSTLSVRFLTSFNTSLIICGSHYCDGVVSCDRDQVSWYTWHRSKLFKFKNNNP